MERLNKFGLLNSLIGIINEEEEDETFVNIAKYLLRNYQNINQLNIYEMADACYVSRASIRRFMQALGYNNFSDFREQAITVPLHYYFSDEKGKDAEYPMCYAEDLYNMAKDINGVVELNIGMIVDWIHEANQIVFLVSDIYRKHCMNFQRKMVLSGKVIRIVSKKFEQNLLLSSLGKTDFLITVSISGFFANQMQELLEGVKCRKMLITGRHEKMYGSVYEHVQFVSQNNIESYWSVYHDYAAEYLLDIIYHEYQKRYITK